MFAIISAHGAFGVWRVRRGIRANNLCLRRVAAIIGDDSIPANSRFGATWGLTVILAALAAVATVLSVLRAMPFQSERIPL